MMHEGQSVKAVKPFASYDKKAGLSDALMQAQVSGDYFKGLHMMSHSLAFQQLLQEQTRKVKSREANVSSKDM